MNKTNHRECAYSGIKKHRISTLVKFCSKFLTYKQGHDYILQGGHKQSP